MTPFNSALSYNIRNAVEGLYPEYADNYQKALLNKGQLAQATGAECEASELGKVLVSWNNNSDDINANADDKALLIAYCPAKNQAITSKTTTRADMTGEIQVPVSFSSETVCIWIIFQSADEQLISDSFYVGEMTML